MSQAEVASQTAEAADRATKRDQPAVVHDRSLRMRVWYEFVRFGLVPFFFANGGLRAGGRHNVPPSGPALLVSNHASHLDSFIVGIPLQRPLNFVARSTLFLPILGPMIRSVGGFPIQREGMGAAGLKETLKRLRAGGIVILFPEGTRSHDGRVAELKTVMAVMAMRAKVSIVPAAIAGSFEAWPRTRSFPRPHPTRVEYGPAIQPGDIAGMSAQAVTELIRERILACHREALRGLARDRGIEHADS